MASDQEKFEREERARRLKLARQRAGISGPKGVVDASNGAINENAYKAHEQGRNGFTVSDGRVYAELFGVPLTWLYLGVEESRPSGDVEAQLRSALLAYGVDREDLGRAVSAVKVFVDDHDEQSSERLPDDQSEPANDRRESVPSR